jgi:hypothetical protein
VESRGWLRRSLNSTSGAGRQILRSSTHIGEALKNHFTNSSSRLVFIRLPSLDHTLSGALR